MAKRRLEEIDGLRGIAALSVMLGHWGEATKKAGAPPGWAHAIQAAFLDDWSFGRLGIVAFFCISGFVVPFSFRGERPMIAFPLSRAFRLYPAYWVSVLLAAAVFPLVNGPALTTPQVLANLTMLQFGLRQSTVLGVYWTLWIELVFYGIVYAMFGAGKLYSARANLTMMCVFLLLALAGGTYRWIHPVSDLPIGVPTYLAAMHFGTIARLRERDPSSMPSWFYPLSLALLVVGVMSANTLAYYYATNELVGWIAADVAYLVGVGLFLGAVHRRWFRGSVLAFLGLISYSMYLFHMIFIDVFRSLFPVMPSWGMAVIVYTPIYFALTLVVATIVHHFVEKPAIGWGRTIEGLFVQRLRPRPA